MRTAVFHFNPYALSPLVGCIVLLALSRLVVARKREGGLHLAFAAINLVIAAWNLDIFLLYTLRDARLAHLVDRLFQPLLVVIPLVWINFVTLYLGSRRRRAIMAVYLPWTAALFCLAPTKLFLSGTVSMYFGYYGRAGPLYFLYVLTHLVTLVMVTAMLVSHLRRAADPLARNQLAYLLLATVVMGLLSADNFFPMYGVERYPMGNIAVIVYLVIMGLAVIRYRFMDLQMVVRQSLIYSVATTLLTVLYFALIFLLEGLVRIYLLPESLFIPLLPALAVAFMFHGVKDRVQTRLDSIFGHEKRRTAIISSFAKAAPAAADRRELAGLFCRKVASALCPERQAFFTRTSDGGRWRAELDGGMGAADLALLGESFLPATVGEETEMMEVPESAPGEEGGVLAARVRQLGFCLLVPLKGPSILVGACLLGPRSPGGTYSGEDRAFIGALAGQAASVLEAREYYERWRREEKFTSLGRASAIISHELRNPLNVIRGSVACLKNRCRGEEVARFTDIINQEVDRTSLFIEQFLRAARVPSAHPREVELGPWLSRFAAAWSGGCPGVSVRLDLPAEPVRARLDPLLLGQLMDNLCRNAAEAMGLQGRLTLAARSLSAGEAGGPRAAMGPGDTVLLMVSDEGPGISQEHRELIFDPFFTTKSGGTGLGLCLVEGVVRAHDGRIEVDSPAGGGATFRIFLPAAPAPGGADHPGR